MKRNPVGILKRFLSIQDLLKELDTHEAKRESWDDAVASISDWLTKNGEDELAAQIVDLFEVKGRVVASLFSQYEDRIMEAERAGVSRIKDY